ncbi:hypothetical protein M0R45_020384 [Rubus argutus]|uniref:Transcription elongation factor 1 homolog n=1 Tax=Rubus argutus TaxID=59490 RepID=A0AAW1XBQ6_RUBAR
MVGIEGEAPVIRLRSHNWKPNSELIETTGKRKSSAKPAAAYKKRVEKLDTVFTCPFCNYGSSVECHFNMEKMVGAAVCYVCQERFGTNITPLTEAIDIYSEWIDECERVNKRD